MHASSSSANLYFAAFAIRNLIKYSQSCFLGLLKDPKIAQSVVVSNMKTAQLYPSFNYKIGTAPKLSDQWIKYEF